MVFKKTKVFRVLRALFLLLWPVAAVRFGYFLLVTPLLPHGNTAPVFSDAYFLAHFFFLGLIVLCIFLTFRVDCRGKKLFLLLPPLCFLFLLSLPVGCWDGFPFLAEFVSRKFWYNETVHHILFFTYVLAFVKGVAETMKKTGKNVTM